MSSTAAMTLGICLFSVILTSCAPKPKPFGPACTGFNELKPFTVQTSAPAPLAVLHSADWFEIADVFSFRACPGHHMYYPGAANAAGQYHPGDTLVVYVTSASFYMTFEAVVDVRMALLDITQPILEPGWASLGVPGMIYAPVATLAYNNAPEAPGMIINSVTGLQAERVFDPPLVLTFHIPEEWTGVYVIGPSFEFNSGVVSDGNYAYHVRGATYVVPGH